jgi:glutamyl-tRNA reductase
MVSRFHVLAFTHKYVEINDIGRMHREGSNLQAGLTNAKNNCKLDEVVYLSTCNRVEIMFFTSEKVNEAFIKKLIKSLLGLGAGELRWAIENGKLYRAEDALRHLFYVTSSIDSLVVGEREIITQVRTAFEEAEKMKLAADFCRVIFRSAIETAKRVYTQTQVAHNPVSIVSLAFRKLLALNPDKHSRILILGAGQTNTVLATYLKKQGFGDFTVVNRTFSKAELLAKSLGGKAFPLTELGRHKIPFDLLIYCTSAETAMISTDLWEKLLGEDVANKTVVDLSVPAGLEKAVLDKFMPTYIGIVDLKVQARQNLDFRQKEVEKCKVIVAESIEKTVTQIRQREVELALSFIPAQMKAIRQKATNEVFVKQIMELDESGQKLVMDLIDYLEKKYIGLPMRMAREHLK